MAAINRTTSAAVVVPAPAPETTAASMMADIKRFEADLLCPICQELFVEAVTTECGHSFCRNCVESWLKTKLSCPVCRQPMLKAPVTCLGLERAVDFVTLVSGKCAEDRLRARRSAALQEREMGNEFKSKFERDFQNALCKGAVMLQIGRPWSCSERLRFFNGIQKHQGVPSFRESYCAVVGLTKEWIGRATNEELLIAANNIMLRDSDQRAGVKWNETCIFQLRCRLEMFIQYG